MEPDYTLSCSQEPATCPYPYPEPYQSNPTPRGSVIEDVLIFSSSLHLRLVAFALKSPLQTLYALLLFPICGTSVCLCE